MRSRQSGWPFLSAIALLGAWLAGSASAADAVLSATAPNDAYLLQPGDIVQISVWKEAELQLEALVRPDGGLSFPLAGDVKAAGNSVQQLAATIDQRLREYIPKPVVTVALKQIGGNRIYVLGKVNRPGEFPFAKSIDVMQALAMAGGTTSYAALNDIQILRRDTAEQTAIPFRYGDVEKGRRLGQNVLLHSGDTVVVP